MDCREQGKYRLRRARNQMLVVRDLHHRQKELEGDGVHSPDLSGMPHAHDAKGLDSTLVRKDLLRQTLIREEARLRRYQRPIQEALGSLPMDLYTFCMLYFMNGMTMEETAATMRRSVRQCRRYREKAENLLGERPSPPA